MTDDFELLDAYVATSSQSAFDTLVRRHADWVYAAARRRTGSADLADDVTQATFIVLAQKAKTLSRRPSLAAWLYRVVRYVSIDALRQQTTRQKHERRAARPEAVMPAQMPDESFGGIGRHLDAALDRLPARDRDAVVLYFFSKLTLQQIGQAQRVAASTVQRRLDKSLGRLGAELKRRGVAVGSGATLAASIAAVSHLSAPPSATAGVTGLAVTTKGLASTAAPSSVLAQGSIKAMTLFKAKQVAVAALVIAVTTGATGITLRYLITRSAQAVSAPTARPTAAAVASAAPGLPRGLSPAEARTRLLRIALDAVQIDGDDALQDMPASLSDTASWSFGRRPAAEWSPAVRRFALDRFRAAATRQANGPVAQQRLRRWLDEEDPLASATLELIVRGTYAVAGGGVNAQVAYVFPSGGAVDLPVLQQFLNDLTRADRDTLLRTRHLPMNGLPAQQRALAVDIVIGVARRQVEACASKPDAVVSVSFQIMAYVRRGARSGQEPPEIYDVDLATALIETGAAPGAAATWLDRTRSS